MRVTAWRLRLAAVSMVLAAVAFVQAPRMLVADTKADLVIDPGGFLARALSLWDPDGSLGQVQNQAYGYLFPMGPFFWLADVAHVPGWVVQRAWWSLLLVVAFLGVVKLAGALGIGTPWARVLGGLAFALSPRILTLIGTSSVEVWPSALAPWVLVPLVLGLRSSRPAFHAALSALAVAAVGGVNAVATFAVVPLGALWLLMASPSPQRRAMIRWWPPLVLLGTLWWIGPLLLLGRYSPPFLDFIESASTTTGVATAYDALRGTTNWIPYLDGNLVAGNQLVSQSYVIVSSVVVVALGFYGLARRDNPVGRFLLAGAVLGLVLVTLGHAGTNLAPGSWQALLDGALAPLRNTHKFDVLIRLPLVLGLVHAATSLARGVTGSRRVQRTGRAAVALLAAASVVGATVPAWTAELPRRGTFHDVPQYWEQAADWLAENAEGQNTLVLPGSAFGDYLWGSPRDEVLQSLAGTPWTVRNAVPLTPSGTIRTLDGFERAFASGRGSTALHDALVRAGIRYVLVREDLSGNGTTDTELVHSTLATTPGVTGAKGFGPRVGNPPAQRTDDGELVFVNNGRQSRHRAIEVFEVDGADAASVRAQDLRDTTVLAGAADAVVESSAAIAGDSDVLLAQDVPASVTPEHVVLTDTLRRREAAFGRVVNNRSAPLSVQERYRVERRVHDYVVGDEARWTSVPQVRGAASVTASSSASDVTQTSIRTDRSPWSALDGDDRTRWTAGESDLRPWIELRFDEPVDVRGTSVRLTDAFSERDVTVTTDGGTAVTPVPAGGSVTLDVPEGTTTRLRLTADSNAFDSFSIDELEVPGAEVARPLRLPTLPQEWPEPDEVLLTTATAPNGACRSVPDVREARDEDDEDVRGSLVVRCDAGAERLGEDGRTLDRVLTLHREAGYLPALTVLPEPGLELDEAFAGRLGVQVSSTSSGVPRAGALATTDGDIATGWTARLSDRSPQLTLRLDRERRVGALRLYTDDSLAASAVREADLTFDDGSTQSVRFDAEGVARFDDVRTRSIVVDVTRVRVRSSLGFDGLGNGLAVGVSEIGVAGVDAAADAAEPVRLPCGSGPEVTVDGRTYRTRVVASRQAVLSLQPVGARLCGTESFLLGPGEHRVTVRASGLFRPSTMRLLRNLPQDAGATALDAERTKRSVRAEAAPSADDQVVSLAQTWNQGWTADGATSVTVSGWKQGWILPAGTGLDAGFGGQLPYGLALGLGAVALLALLGLTVWLRRRPGTTRSDARPRPVRVPLGAVGTAAACLLVGGWVGLAAGVVGGVVGWLVARRLDPAPLAAALVLAAGMAYVVRPWTSPQGWAGEWSWPQWLVLAGFGVVAASLVRAHGARTSLSRIAGRSTSR
jgi:arabinofuranan 3-O-arabinosyltransferase